MKRFFLTASLLLLAAAVLTGCSSVITAKQVDAALAEGIPLAMERYTLPEGCLPESVSAVDPVGSGFPEWDAVLNTPLSLPALPGTTETVTSTIEAETSEKGTPAYLLYRDAEGKLLHAAGPDKCGLSNAELKKMAFADYPFTVWSFDPETGALTSADLFLVSFGEEKAVTRVSSSVPTENGFQMIGYSGDGTQESLTEAELDASGRVIRAVMQSFNSVGGSSDPFSFNGQTVGSGTLTVETVYLYDEQDRICGTEETVLQGTFGLFSVLPEGNGKVIAVLPGLTMNGQKRVRAYSYREDGTLSGQNIVYYSDGVVSREFLLTYDKDGILEDWKDLNEYIPEETQEDRNEYWDEEKTKVKVRVETVFSGSEYTYYTHYDESGKPLKIEIETDPDDPGEWKRHYSYLLLPNGIGPEPPEDAYFFSFYPGIEGFHLVSQTEESVNLEAGTVYESERRYGDPNAVNMLRVRETLPDGTVITEFYEDEKGGSLRKYEENGTLTVVDDWTIERTEQTSYLRQNGKSSRFTDGQLTDTNEYESETFRALGWVPGMTPGYYSCTVCEYDEQGRITRKKVCDGELNDPVARNFMYGLEYETLEVEEFTEDGEPFCYYHEKGWEMETVFRSDGMFRKRTREIADTVKPEVLEGTDYSGSVIKETEIIYETDGTIIQETTWYRQFSEETGEGKELFNETSRYENGVLTYSERFNEVTGTGISYHCDENGNVVSETPIERAG